MTVDVFNLVSDWYHDAILELSRVPGFRPEAAFISRRLGITSSEAQAAMERLIRVGLVQVKPDGSWHETLGDNTTTIDIDYTNVALRNLQKQVLQMSMQSLEETPKALRDHTSTTLAINIQDLPEAKKQIKAFRLNFMKLLQRKPSQFNEVYQLSVSLFPLTKTNLKSRSKI